MKKRVIRILCGLIVLGGMSAETLKAQDAAWDWSTASEEWGSGTKVFNPGAHNEVHITLVGGKIDNKKPCALSSQVKTYSINSSESAYLEVSLPAGSNYTIEAIAYEMSGNSSGSKLLDGPLVYCPEEKFNENNVTLMYVPFYGYDQACSNSSVPMLEGVKSFRIYRRVKYTAPSGSTPGKIGSGTNSGSNQTTNVKSLNVYLLVMSPFIEHTGGGNPAFAEELSALAEPVVFSYNDLVADAANIKWEWYTDNTYTTVAAAPAGLSFALDAGQRKLTLSGTPERGTAGTHYYAVRIDENKGNTIQGSIEIAPYITPAPEFGKDPDNMNQTVKAGFPISKIEFEVAYAAGVTATGLPDGVTADYADGTILISGTPTVIGEYTYTISPTPLEYFTGTAPEKTGTITVRNADVTAILYLTFDHQPSQNDLVLYPALQSNDKFLITVKKAGNEVLEAEAYASYSLIVLNEEVSANNGEAIGIKSVDKPVLNLKSFMYLPGRWDCGIANNGAPNNGVIKVTEPEHPVFRGMAVSEGSELAILSQADKKAVQPTTITNGYEIASAASLDGSGGTVAIHDIPAASRGVDSAKYLLIAISNNSYARINAVGLQLLTNAVEYLLHGEQFVSSKGEYSGNPVIKSNSVFFDGSVIVNSECQSLELYDITGSLLTRSNGDIDLYGKRGVFIVRSPQGTFKIAAIK